VDFIDPFSLYLTEIHTAAHTKLFDMHLKHKCIKIGTLGPLVLYKSRVESDRLKHGMRPLFDMPEVRELEDDLLIVENCRSKVAPVKQYSITRSATINTDRAV
jgi:hypothetical protein